MSELPECSTRANPKARKEHRCCECRGTIFIGEHYEKESGIWAGEPASFKTCSDCTELRKSVNAEIEYDDEKNAFGDMCSYIETDEESSEFLRIMRKRNAKINDSWLKWESEMSAPNKGSL